MSHLDQVLFRNFKAVLGALAVIGIVFFYVAAEVAEEETPNSEMQAALDAKVAKNIAPAGKVSITGETSPESEAPQQMAAASSQATPRSGEAVYNSTCVGCHDTGAAGAPKRGDAAAWAPKIAAGLDAMMHNATKGINAMPPKGLCMDCSDEELKSAIKYVSGI